MVKITPQMGQESDRLWRPGRTHQEQRGLLGKEHKVQDHTGCLPAAAKPAAPLMAGLSSRAAPGQHSHLKSHLDTAYHRLCVGKGPGNRQPRKGEAQRKGGRRGWRLAGILGGGTEGGHTGTWGEKALKFSLPLLSLKFPCGLNLILIFSTLAD